MITSTRLAGQRFAVLGLARSGLASVESLLAGGADHAARDSYGDSALHVAASLGHTQIVLALLTAGADLAAANNGGQTALHLASYFGFTQTVQALLRQIQNSNVSIEMPSLAESLNAVRNFTVKQ